MPLCSIPCAGAWSDGIGSPKEHEAFLRVGEATIILARHASFLGRCLLALSLFWSTGLSQKALEEFAVLVEVLDGGRHGWCMDSP